MPTEEVKDKEWKLIKSEPGPDLRIFQSRFDWLENPRNKKVLQAVILQASDWVNVVAVTPEEKIVTVSQFRFGIRRQSLEIPAGLVDPGESPLAAAKRELAEETGFAAEEWSTLGWSFANPAFLDNRAHHFLARNAAYAGLPQPEDGEDILQAELTLDEIRRAILDGRMRNAMTLLALSKVFDMRV
jgi:ADP-ribose pyrophosphatase